MHSLMIIARLTADPELKTFQRDGKNDNVCNFSIADNTSNRTDFFSCVAFGKTAEFVAKYFSKGSMICFRGKIRTEQYQDKETGKNRVAYKLVAEECNFGESKATVNSPAAHREEINSLANTDLSEFVSATEGGLPF